MTGRLKRKLNDLGVDTGSSKATENFCLIGTPLPPLEKSKDTGEFVPVWKQEVRDEKGRRRLHGAFTGGFSAGYFNTVGSKEGWAPSEFRSSRTERAKAKAARPEDFMDEEDLTELRDSQKLVDTTEEMDLNFWERRKAGEATEEKDSITSALEAALLPAPRDSVGAQILKKMGWRVGHGIGPKISYEHRKRQDALSHAPAGSGEDLQDVEDHEEAKKHLYPPRDTRVPVFKRKDNKHGLGYEPGMGLSDIVASEAGGKGNKKPMQGPDISAGFGLGALNDADDDDLDVYDRGFVQSGRKLAYDADDDDERIAIGGLSKVMRPSSQTSGASLSILGRTTFNNGLPCVHGFVVAKKPITEENLFPPPVVPKEWSPDPRRVWEQDKENFKEGSLIQDSAKQVPTGDSYGGRRAIMSANQRGSLLGETTLPAAPRSVFDYLAPKDRERLKNLTTKPEPGPTIPEPEPSIPRLDAQVAKMALQGFQPFTNDPVKQTRYTAYLKAQAAGEDSVPFSRMPGQAADAFARELEDYARSAQIFKPVSGAMAGRFTRAAVVEVGSKATEGLHRPEEGGSYFSTPGEDEKEKEPEKEESPKENAARLGMFGPLTREVKPWVPARLLCKRFGVKEPEVELHSEPTKTTESSNWQTGGVLAITDGTEAGLAGATKIGENDGESKPGPSKATRAGGSRDLSNIGLGDEDETQGRDILTYERPDMDIFKAIFASDDEGEEDRGDASDDNESKPDGKTPSANGNVNGTSNNEPPNMNEKPSGDTAPSSSAEPVDYNNAAGKVDMTAFKPTFVPRSDRAKGKDKEKKHEGKDRDKDKDRERKKKKSKTSLVSFEVEEEGGEGVRERSRDRESEKKRKKKKREKKVEIGLQDDEEDEGMWVEKPPPEVVQNVTVPAFDIASNADAEDGGAAGPPRGRKRAIDFM
ncbi:uncharacterized protein FOMMEDRAFT_137805 [Fomitiporia mediterranea MF3/22]|uniref:uncharacterized protein n=1 Tax=Fomitiporia mediterranea (strain MF3/22) TaxID=694068 RepID=UPI0004407FC6|nr:uncharacterized protein FOMMEDRAFT_137805 [Fomitiporia mediterranea MF3/22]EJD07516.1 hypothetical protein FOMMEDRAFT_137805 [Fomitiporia mediterranea MF3/22]